ncbi:GNAT family N-acyltransferase [Aquimarina agarivorans]|uniref:GNAT family N-acyltransferase n=1 Tax=Aquimarina agarivorans TaxID=980584 RepID=UPI000248E6F1|nr:lysophospholipid acyltransferase family protein [Aquimarina agarivorans]
MSLVAVNDLSKLLRITKLGPIGSLISWTILKITRISKINKRYQKNKHLSCQDFIDVTLKEYKITYRIPKKDLKNIPDYGPFVTISNHPFGGIEGLIILKTLHKKRPDYKAIANFLLQRFDPLSEAIIAVNPFENHQNKKSSIGGLKEAIFHLKEGKPFGVFPAGEVSNIKKGDYYIDKPWNDGVMRLIRRAKVPVVPFYFHGKNSKLFYRLAAIHPLLQSAKLPSELFSQKNKIIQIRIGKPISVKKQQQYTDIFEYKAFLRKKTYLLAKSFDKTRLADKLPKKASLKKIKNIIDPISKKILVEEIDNCIAKKLSLFKTQSFELFLAQKKDIPNILTEIGRLREITYRTIGEGTNQSVDLDKYDNYYRHLFLWDTKNQDIIGAYRMGFGNEIMTNYGIKGFYLHSLFRFEPELYPMLENSIEMGRSFIRNEYQKQPLPLFLLWKGIMHCTLKFPNHNFLIGGVTISDKFSSFSMSLMVEFMKSNYYDPIIAQFVKPKKEYKVTLTDPDKGFVFDESKKNLKQLEEIIADIEPDGLRIPVLLKKYVKQNAKVIAFNVDPLFNNAVDGLMYIKISDLPDNTVKPLLQEIENQIETN